MNTHHRSLFISSVSSRVPWLRAIFRPGLLLALFIALSTSRVSAQDPLQAFNKQAYERAMAELQSAKTEEERFYALGSAAKTSLTMGRDEEARGCAEELERLTLEYPKNWNYGNAIQDANIVLGRLALKAGKVDEAKKRLLAAGQSPGSPQMKSFGPNMSLAHDLLLKGEKAVVLEYFGLCAKFWDLKRGKLDEWKSDVEAGRIPDFGANLIY